MRIYIILFVTSILSLTALPQGLVVVDAKVCSTKKVNDNNTYSDWKQFETLVVDSLRGFELKQREYSKYGFIKSIQGTKTGFFHVEKINGSWWMIDPEGYAGLNIAVSDVKQGGSKVNRKAFDAGFSGEADWMQKTMDMLRDDGFNGTGAWSNNDAIRNYNKSAKYPFSYTACLYWMKQYSRVRGISYSHRLEKNPEQCIFVFDPEFETFCMEKAKELIADADDPNVLGYFTDNEIPFSKKNLEGYFFFPEDDPGHQAALAYLKEKGIDRSRITDKHRLEFAGIVAEKYFSIVSKAFRKYDKNHMFLGTRFHASAKQMQSVITASGKYLDVISVNYYGHWSLKEKHYSDWSKYTDKPFIISEFYTKGEDSGLPNLSGAGWIVRDQTDRGRAYQNFCLSMLKAPACVGWHWFKYIDNDPTNTKADKSNRDSNKGMVNNLYQPYTDLTKYMKQLNRAYPDLIEYFKSK